MDLSSLSALLAGLGPWGIAVGIGLTLLTQFLRNRVSPPVVPPVVPPTPPAVPSRLEALLALLASLFAPKSPAGATTQPDIDHDTVLKLVALAKELSTNK